MLDFAQPMFANLRALPRRILCAGGLLAVGAGVLGSGIIRSDATSSLAAPGIALVTAGLLAWFAIDKLAQLAAKRRSRGLGTALWDRMTRRRPQVTSKAELDAERQLQERWRDVHALLEGKGYDFYTLPWYLIFGASQSGKTTLVQRSGLEFPIGDRPVAEYGSTRNCTWFFTNRAILIDTAGRYVDHRMVAAPGDAERESAQEWRHFLALLRKHRPRSPLNGIILVVKVPDIMAPDAATRDRTGAMLRDAMRDIESELRIQCPVYVMVTMCDRILGFTDFFKSLPGLADRSLLGWSRSGPFTAPLDVKEIELGLDALIARLRAMRLEFLRETRPSAVEPPDTTAFDRLFAFPEEFAALHGRLREILAVAFAPSSYHQTPFLRGVYFTSALQKDDPFSDASAALLGDSPPIKPSTEPHDTPTPAPIRAPAATRSPAVAGDSKAYFVADFLEEKVFKEVGLVRPTSRADRRRRRIERATLVAALGAVIAAACVRVSDVFRANELFARVVQRTCDWSPLCLRIANVRSASTYAGVAVQQTLHNELVRDFAAVFKNALDKERRQLPSSPWSDETYLANSPWLLSTARVIAGSVGDDGATVREPMLEVLRRLGAASDDARALAALLEPAGALTLWRQALEPIKEQFLADITRDVAGYWDRLAGLLQKSPTEIQVGSHGKLWGDVVKARLRERALHSVKQTGILIEQAVGDTIRDNGKAWQQLRDEIAHLRRAVVAWVLARSATQTLNDLHRAAMAGGVTGQLPLLERVCAQASADPDADQRTGVLLEQLGALVDDLTRIVTFDPRSNGLFKSDVWLLTSWKDGELPPRVDIPSVPPNADAELSRLREILQSAGPGLVKMAERRALLFLDQERRLPLADHSPLLGNASEDSIGHLGAPPGEVERFLPQQARKAGALFARLRKIATGPEAGAIDEIAADYERRLGDFWDIGLVDILRPEATCTDDDHALALLRHPHLAVEDVYKALGVDADTRGARPEPGVIFKRFSSIEATKEIARAFGDSLGRLRQSLPSSDVARNSSAYDACLVNMLKAAIDASKVLQSACAPSATGDPVRAALVRHARHVRQALSVLAQGVLARHWLRPQFFKEHVRAAGFPFSGNQVDHPDLAAAVDYFEAMQWLRSEHLKILAEAVWPAVDDLHQACGVFDVGLTPNTQLCFVRTMRLRRLLTTDRMEIRLRSVERGAIAEANTLQAGWLRLVIKGTEMSDSGPFPVNNFRFDQAFDCSNVSTMRFEADQSRERGRAAPWHSMPIACLPEDGQAHWYPLAFLFLQRESCDSNQGLRCRARFTKGTIQTREQSPSLVAKFRLTAPQQHLRFWAMPLVGGQPDPLALPDELPDLAQAGFSARN